MSQKKAKMLRKMKNKESVLQIPWIQQRLFRNKYVLKIVSLRIKDLKDYYKTLSHIEKGIFSKEA